MNCHRMGKKWSATRRNPKASATIFATSSTQSATREIGCQVPMWAEWRPRLRPFDNQRAPWLDIVRQANLRLQTADPARN